MILRNVRSAETLRLSENYYAMAGATQPAKLLLAFANARLGRFDTAHTLTESISAHNITLPEESVMFYYACDREISQPSVNMSGGLRPFERELIATRLPASG